jgi:4-diphosphocytidyl-2-C-methyl-D-erythritol kinase
MMSAIAYAKINLALHVRRRRDDGYHELETIFAFAEDGDRIAADWNGPAGLTLEGEFAPLLAGEDPQDNLVMRGARALAQVIGGAVPGFHLDKRLPVAAGIGGGSADAAAAMRMLCERAGVPIDDPRVVDVARSLGADVPACLFSQSVRGDGRGDELIAVEAGALAGMPLLLVNPRVPLATGPVFRAWDGEDRGALGDGDPLAVALAGRNDLEAPAVSICPVIAEAVALLAKQGGVRLARMSGSGATCFALFGSEADRDAASAAIGRARPDWWRMATRVRA